MARQIRVSLTSQHMSKEERGTWDTIDELIACYERDHKEIEAADQVLSAVGELQRPHADVPGSPGRSAPGSVTLSRGIADVIAAADADSVGDPPFTQAQADQVAAILAAVDARPREPIFALATQAPSGATVQLRLRPMPGECTVQVRSRFE